MKPQEILPERGHDRFARRLGTCAMVYGTFVAINGLVNKDIREITTGALVGTLGLVAALNPPSFKQPEGTSFESDTQ